MANWQPTYDDAQRGGVEEAYLRGVRPVRLICELAARGELSSGGEPVPAFEIPGTSARYIGDRALRRRQGDFATKLAKMPARDSVELLRRRYLSVIDHELARIERQAAKRDSKPVDAVFLIKLARLTRELAALPGPDEQRLPRKLGERPGDGTPQRERPLDNDLSRQILRAAGATNGHP